MSTRIHPLAAGLLVALGALLAGCASSTSAPALPEASTQVSSGAVPAGYRTPAESDSELVPLAFLIGAWEGSGLGGRVEEYWSPAGGGTMMGTFRILEEHGTSLYEFLVIETDDRGVRLRFLHFDPGLKPWEEQPLTLRLTHVAVNEAVFEAEDEAQNPARMTYSITTDGKLSVVVGSRGKEGVQHEFGVKYTRMKRN